MTRQVDGRGQKASGVKRNSIHIKRYLTMNKLWQKPQQINEIRVCTKSIWLVVAFTVITQYPLKCIVLKLQL